MTDWPLPTRQALAHMTAPGLHVLTQLMFIEVGQTVVYHVGKLPDDAKEEDALRERYRAVAAPLWEIAAIVSIAHAGARKGECILMEMPINDDTTVYYAVGQKP